MGREPVTLEYLEIFGLKMLNNGSAVRPCQYVKPWVCQHQLSLLYLDFVPLIMVLVVPVFSICCT